MADGGAIEARVEVRSSRFDEADERWQRQADQFVQELSAHLPGAVSWVGGSPQPGAKGTAGTVLLALTSGGVVTAAVELARSWVGRDRGRSVRVEWRADGELQAVEISGDRLNPDAIDRMVSRLADQLDRTSRPGRPDQGASRS